MCRCARALIMIVVSALCARESACLTRVVPIDAPTIQEAIASSAPGDTVAVLPGTYVENIVIDRDIVVRSVEGPAVTIIDGSASLASVVYMEAGSVEGFDIRNGCGTNIVTGRAGGGVFVLSEQPPGPLIMGNWIHDNTLPTLGIAAGAGIAADGPSTEGVVRIVGNRIYSNAIQDGAYAEGAAVNVFGGYGTESLVEGNEIFDNDCPWRSGGTDRGAVACWRDVRVRNNKIAANTGWLASALYVSGGLAENNTIVTNLSQDFSSTVRLSGDNVHLVTFAGNNVAFNIGPGVECWDPPMPPEDQFILECNNIFGNGPGGQVVGDCGDVIGLNGNISVDPLFERTTWPYEPGSWCLSENSPLLLDPPPGCGLIGATDVCAPIGVGDAGPAPRRRLAAEPPRPNPFTERTAIAFYQPRPGEVEVQIYNVLGRRLRTLHAGWLPAGDHQLEWDGRWDSGERAASGAYVARIRAGGEELTRTLLLIR